jgi:hypothetical protein
MRAMTEREACALLKSRFEEAGYRIAENQPFAEAGVQFEIDGYDAAARVGYEYITDEAGDGWDVDGSVIATLDEHRKQGDLHILIIDETAAPDAAALDRAARAFLLELPKPRAEVPAKPKRAAKATAAPKDKKPDAPAKPKRAAKATAAPKKPAAKKKS